MVLRNATEIEELKVIRANAKAIEIKLRSLKVSTRDRNAAIELVIRSERRLAEEIATIISYGGDKRVGSEARSVTLSELGVEQTEYYRWRQLRRIPLEILDEYFTRFEGLASRERLIYFAKHASR